MRFCGVLRAAAHLNQFAIKTPRNRRYACDHRDHQLVWKRKCISQFAPSFDNRECQPQGSCCCEWHQRTSVLLLEPLFCGGHCLVLWPSTFQPTNTQHVEYILIPACVSVGKRRLRSCLVPCVPIWWSKLVDFDNSRRSNAA